MRETNQYGVEQLTRDEAIALHDSKVWESWSHDEIVSFQLFQDCLAVPFGRFQEAMEAVLKRPVWTHEFSTDGSAELVKEYWGQKPAPTFEQICALIPAEKLIVIISGDNED